MWDGPPVTPSALSQDSKSTFHLTAKQLLQASQLRMMYEFSLHSDGEDETGVHRSMLMKLCMLLIQQDVNEAGIPTLTFFSRILGYNKKSELWQEPQNYMNILAGILWCMRVLTLEFALPQKGRNGK